MRDLNDIQAKLQGIKPTTEATGSVGGGKKDSEESKNRKKGETNGKIDRRKFNKGHPQSGRKPSAATVVGRSFKLWMEQHATENVKVVVFDKKTGKTIEIQKPRRAYAIEKLFELGTKGVGNAAAIDLWLSRYVGKAAQPIRGEGEDDPPIKLHVDNLGDILKKAYGDNESD